MYKLTKTDIQTLVFENKYTPSAEAQTQYRDTYGEIYERNENAPAIVMPGGFLGEVVIVLATAATYGLEVDAKKVLKTMETMIKNSAPASSLYIDGLRKYAKEYSIEDENLKILEPLLVPAKNIETTWTGAVVMIKGEYGIHPRFMLNTQEAQMNISIPLLQQSFVSEQRRAFAEALIKGQAIKLDPEDEEYLYEVMSDVAETHFYLSARLCCLGLPLYAVKFNEKEELEVEELGEIT